MVASGARRRARVHRKTFVCVKSKNLKIGASMRIMSAIFQSPNFCSKDASVRVDASAVCDCRSYAKSFVRATRLRQSTSSDEAGKSRARHIAVARHRAARLLITQTRLHTRERFTAARVLCACQRARAPRVARGHCRRLLSSVGGRADCRRCRRRRRRARASISNANRL